MITSIWTNPGGDASAARDIRRAVFEEELQLDPALTWDSSDNYAYHLVLLLNNVPVAAGRITYGGVGIAKLGRICVLKKYRRQGIGDGLVKILDYRASEMGMRYSQADAAEGLESFYRRIGYRPCGDPYTKWGQLLTPMKKETNDGTVRNCADQCAGT